MEKLRQCVNVCSIQREREREVNDRRSALFHFEINKSQEFVDRDY